MHPLKDNLVQVGREGILNLSWELVTHCQFSCSYCYFKPYESDINYSDVKNIILKRIENMTTPLSVTLLGGEPTLHPDFHEIVDRLASMPHVDHIDIVTNLQPTVEFWGPLLKNKGRIEIVASYHVEYARELFFKKVATLKKDFPINIIFMVHNDIKYLPKMKDAVKAYLENHIDDVPIIFRRLIDSETVRSEFDYPRPIIDFFEEMEEKIKASGVVETVTVTTKDESFEISELEFANKGLNKFKGWKCQMNALIVHADGTVNYPCTNIKKHILFAELKSREMICPHDICPCEHYWNFKKEKV